METDTVSPVASKLTEEENDALASQLMELIGGIAGGPRQTPEEELEERDLWSLEEGDDSVFYSDEEQAQRDLRHAAMSALGAGTCRRLANSVADDYDDPAQQMEVEDTVDASMQQMIWTEEMQRRLEVPKTEEVISVAIEGSCAELTSTRPLGQTRAAEKVNQQDQEETAAPDRDAFYSNMQNHERLNRETDVLKPLKLSNSRQLERDREGGQDQDFHQNHSPGYFTLPLMKKAAPNISQQKSFNHLSASKYSTTSYRRIRQGNTRQKIEEFEFIMKNQ
ncbi:unnamed protein product [Ophioblennius macclurei]